MAKKKAAAHGKGKPAHGKKKEAPKAREKRDFKTTHSHLFKKRPRHAGIGGDLPHKKDLSRMVRWPKYVRVQRQRAILKNRLKVPPAIHQFSQTLDKNHAAELFKLMAKYRPETRKEKKHRMYEEAKEKEQNKGQDKAQDPSTKPRVLKFGLKHVTQLVEQKKAKLVIIAHDVAPIELVIWLPALCKRMEVPYCIVKGKDRLGAFVHQKTAACLCFTEVRKGNDDATLAKLVENVKPLFNDAPSRTWGGGKLGVKTRARLDAIERELAREEAQKMEF